MGRALQFFPSRRREPVAAWKPYKGENDIDGKHEGIRTANVPWDAYLLCQGQNGLDVSVYTALHSTIDMDGMADLLEMREVSSSWESAYKRNADEKAALAKGRR